MKTIYIKSRVTTTNCLGETTNKGDVLKAVDAENVVKITTEKRNITLTYTNGFSEMYKRSMCDLVIE